MLRCAMSRRRGWPRRSGSARPPGYRRGCGSRHISPMCRMRRRSTGSATTSRGITTPTRSISYSTMPGSAAAAACLRIAARNGSAPSTSAGRSEEHTSELQSQSNLVCRLLPEKKNQDDARYGLRCCHLKTLWTAPLPPATALSRQMTTSTPSLDIMGLPACYANLPTDQERDDFMQRYHDVISSFGGKTSYDADNRPLLVMRSNLWASGYDVYLSDQRPLPQFSLFPYTTLFR